MKLYLVFILLTLFILPSSAVFTYVETINGTGGDYEDLDDAFDSPVSIWVKDGILYVSDTDENLVYMMDDNDIDRKFGDSEDHENELYRPRSLYFKDEKLYICDSNDAQIKMYDKRPGLSIFSKDKSFFNDPYGITFLDGYFYVVDNENSRIYVHNEDESYERTYINNGRFNGQLDRPSDIFASQDKLYIADTGNNRIEVFSSNLTFLNDFGKGREDIFLNRPEGVFVNEKFVFVADTGENRIVVFDLQGNPLEILGIEETKDTEETDYIFDEPKDVFYYEDKVYVADTGNGRVQIYDFELELPVNAMSEKLDIAENKLEEIKEVINKSQVLNIDIETELEEYYKNASFFYLERKYKESEEVLDSFDERYINETNEINDILNDSLPNIILNIDKSLGEYALYFDISEGKEALTHAEDSYDEEIYFEALNYVYVAKQILLEIESPTEVIIETDVSLETRLNKSINDLKTLEQTISVYQQNIQLTSLNQKIDVAESYLEIGDLKNTKTTLDNFDTEFNSSQNSFNETKILIDEALDKINEAENSGNTFFNMDLQKAKTIVYEDPEEAKELAEKVLNGSSFDSISIGFLILIVVIIVAVFLSYKIVKKTKRRGV